MSRNGKAIDWDRVYREAPILYAMHCTHREVAAHFGIGYDTVRGNEKMQEIRERYRSVGKASIKKAMYKKAVEKDDFAAQKWLSQNWLGYSEKSEIRQENTVADNTLEQLVQVLTDVSL